MTRRLFQPLALGPYTLAHRVAMAPLTRSRAGQPGEPFLGAAEIVQGPMAAALGNAVSNATGRRWLNLPLTRSNQPA